MPNIAEFSRHELMTMEKETTGLYLTGHPMDDYRELVRQHGAVSIGAIMNDFGQETGPIRFRDEQKVTVAGVVSAYKTKTTRNNTLMAYVTLEDDSGSMELLVFARVLDASGGYIKQGNPILVNGRISVRDEKEPQLLCDDIQPLDSLQEGKKPVSSDGKVKKLYIKLPSQNSAGWEILPKILDMFPGNTSAVIVFADTGKRLGTHCLVHDALVAELIERFGQENVVVQS